MSQRLPVVGGDNGTWGTILNGFLGVSLNSDGTLNGSAVSTAGAEMTANKGVASGYAALNSSSQIPFSYIPTGTSGTTVAIGNDSRITGAAQTSNNLSDLADSGSSKYNLHVTMLPAAACVAVSNQSTLSGLLTIDGYTLVAGDYILLVGQSTASQNGLWKVASGAWTRPTAYPSGGTPSAGAACYVKNGTSGIGAMYLLATETAVTIDTTATTWVNPLAQTAFLQYIKSNISPDQLLPAASNTNLGSYRQTNVANGILSSDAANLGQLAGNQYAYVVSGCVWTTAGGTLTASMSSGTVMIGGILLSVAAISSYTFTANTDTYIDFANAGTGFATPTYTAVGNNCISPALANSGTMLNTIRMAIVISGSSITSTSASIMQGGVGFASPTTQFISTVAAGSNGQQIGSLTSSTLSLGTVTTGALSTSGYALVAHASGQTYTISFTGTSGGNLTGVTLLSGTSTLTVSTGDTVTGFTPLSLTDTIGNLVYLTTPYPRMIGFASLVASTTMNLTAMSPIPRMMAPFIIPPGPNKSLKITLSFSYVSSSATAGTQLKFFGGIGNAATYSSVAGTPDLAASVNVTGDGMGPIMGTSATLPLAPGSSTAQVGMTQAATGATVGGPGFFNSVITVEYV